MTHCIVWQAQRELIRERTIKGASVKCVDAFRIALTEEPKLLIRPSHFSKSDKVRRAFTYASNTYHKLLASEPAIGNHILRM